MSNTPFTLITEMMDSICNYVCGYTLYFCFTKQPIYVESTLPPVSISNAASTSMNVANEPRYKTAADWHEISNLPSQDMARSMEKEIICNTPCEDEGNCGPIYCEPPRDEHKIYAQFEGKRFRKLYHKEIWLAIC